MALVLGMIINGPTFWNNEQTSKLEIHKMI